MQRIDIDVDPSSETSGWEQRLTDGSPLLRYACALLLAAAAIAGTLAVPALRTSSPFVLSFGAIALSAWYTGLGPAFVVILVTTLTISVVAEPFDLWRLVVADSVRLGVFTLVAAGITTLATRQRSVTMTLRRQNERLEAVHQLSVAARGSDAIDSLYAKGVGAVETALDASGTAILVADEDGAMSLVAAHGLPTLVAYDDARERRTWEQVSDRAPVVVQDVTTDGGESSEGVAASAAFRELLAADGVHTGVWFPLLLHEKVIGELVVGYRAATSVDGRQILLGETIAAHLAHVVERHRSDEILGEGEAQLRLALRAAGMGSWEYQPGTGRFYWSPEVEAIYGLAPGSLSGTLTAFLKRIHPDDRTAVRHALDDCTKGGVAECDVEYRIDRGDGETRWIAALGRVIPKRGRGMRVSGVCIDVTDRKEAEVARARILATEREARAEVEREHGRTSFLAEASATLGSSLDRETMLRDVANVVVPQIADWCAVDLLDEDGALRRVTVAHVDPDKVRWANDMHRAYPPDPKATRGVHHVIRTGRSEVLAEITDAQLQASAKSPEHLEQLRAVGFRSAIIVPLVARQRTLGALTLVSAESARVFTDADRLLAEELGRRAATAVDNAQLFRQLEQASRAKDEFLATVSHELRTPLNAILGWANMLKSGAVPPEQRDQALGAVERNAAVLTQLVSDVLDVSRIINGQLNLDVEPLRIDNVVDAAVDAVRPTAAAKSVTIERQIDDAARQMTLKGDPARLQQIVWNLLSNAVEFTPGGGTVAVSVAQVGSWIEVRVIDTGEGIEPRFLPHIFERFRQADGSTTRRHGGLGLGLAIVQHLVELHGGSVAAESEGKGRGSTFIVRLPVAAEPAQSAGTFEPAVSASALDHTALSGCRVLAVDDDVDARDLLAYVLDMSGAEARIAASGNHAMQMVEGEWTPDIILLDIGMPGENGYELLTRLCDRLANEQAGSPLAVALTAHAGPENRARALSAGFNLYLPKPLEPPVLIEHLSHLWHTRAPLPG